MLMRPQVFSRVIKPLLLVFQFQKENSTRNKRLCILDASIDLTLHNLSLNEGDVAWPSI